MGNVEGVSVGDIDGLALGDTVGDEDGKAVGELVVGDSEGDVVVGEIEGREVGIEVGFGEGSGMGTELGAQVSFGLFPHPSCSRLARSDNFNLSEFVLVLLTCDNCRVHSSLSVIGESFLAVASVQESSERIRMNQNILHIFSST